MLVFIETIRNQKIDITSDQYQLSVQKSHIGVSLLRLYTHSNSSCFPITLMYLYITV